MCWDAAEASRSDLCNKCMTVAEKIDSVLLLEAPRGHTTFDEGRFYYTFNRTKLKYSPFVSGSSIPERMEWNTTSRHLQSIQDYRTLGIYGQTLCLSVAIIHLTAFMDAQSITQRQD